MPCPGKWGLQPFPEHGIDHGGGSSAFEFSLRFLACHTLPIPVFSLNLPYTYNWRMIFKNMCIFICCIRWQERCYVFLTIKENPNLSSFPLVRSQLIFSLCGSDGLCQTEEFSAPALNGLWKPKLKWYFVGLLGIPVLLGFTRGMVEREACCFNKVLRLMISLTPTPRWSRTTLVILTQEQAFWDEGIMKYRFAVTKQS